MGQRSQIVLISDGVHYGNNNPNDNNGKIYISHNQWRYGTMVIYVLKKVIDKYNKLKQTEINQGEYFFSRIDEIFNSCLRYAENSNINFELSGSHRFEDKTPLFYEQYRKTSSIIEFLKDCTDNNNGWFFIKVNKDKTLQIGFLNGNEENETITQRTPLEYCNLFNQKYNEDIDNEDLANIEEINKIKIFNIDKEIKTFFDNIKKDFED